MSDDFDDLPDDDLFTNPASLLEIEKAVKAAERNAPTQAPLNQVAIGGKSAGKYHHKVAPASSLHLRGRGAHQQLATPHSNGRPPPPMGMGMRPRPPHAPINHQNVRPPVAGVQSRHTSPAIQQLPRAAAPPVPLAAAPQEDDDGEYSGPEFFADEMGNYFQSEVKDVRRQGLDADVLQQGQGAQGTEAVTEASGNGQRSFSRSTSFGPASQAARPNGSSRPADAPNPMTARSTSMNPQRPPPTGSQSLRHPNHVQKPFTRVHSDGENARRAAIQGVFSASQNGTGANQPGSQGSVVRSMGSQVGAGNKNLPQQSLVNGKSAPQRPSAVAGVTQDDIEALRQQVAQMAKEKKEVEEREKKAVQELWRYQGEVKTVRMKADEEKKHAESKFTNLQNQLSNLEETLKSERLGHRRALDTVQTDHAFKMHNEQSSHVKARFGTQRTRQMQSTPSRPNGVSASQQGGASQLLVDNNYAYTPSRSPTKKGAVAPNGRGTRLGSMGPPPVPDLLVSGFMTPKPLTASSRKARLSDGKKVDRNTPTNSKFPGLLDTFTGDSQIPSHKKRNTRKDADDGGRASPTPSFFEEEQVQDYVMHEETYPLVHEEEDVCMDHVQDDIIVEVNHIIFTHFYTPIWETPSESMKTVQRILTSHSSTNQHSSPLFQEKCSSFLEACGNREATPEDFCREVNHALWELLNLMIEAEESVAPATVVSMMQLLSVLCIRVPQYAAGFAAAAMDMPRNMFLTLIAQYWPQAEPAPAGAKSAIAIKGDHDFEEQFTLPWAYRLELGYAVCAMLSNVHSLDGEAPPCFAAFASASEGIRALVSVNSPISVVVDALDLMSNMACDPELFRPLLSVKSERNSQEALDPKRPPLVDSLCSYLKQEHPDASVATGAAICQRVLSIICNLCQAHTDGLTLLGNSFHLVPSLVQLAETLADHIWGICAIDEDVELHFGVLVSVVTVLHMLIFPPESTSQNTPSVHLRSVIARALESPKEYNGLHHVFITALGRISYAPVPDMKKWSRMQVTTLRYLAQDLLSELVGGNQREDDAIYAMYVFSENENASPERNAEEELVRDDGPNEEEEAQSKAMMEIIEIDDD